jgi:hypothetical protein
VACRKRAAELLHIKPTTLNEMIKRYDIRPRRRRTGPEGETEPGNGHPQPATPTPPAQPAGSRRIAAGGYDE